MPVILGQPDRKLKSVQEVHALQQWGQRDLQLQIKLSKKNLVCMKDSTQSIAS